MKSKKVMAGLLSLSILTVSAAAVFAGDSRGISTIKAPEEGINIIPISSQLEIIQQSHFTTFTGVVKEIRTNENIKGSRFALVENEKGMEANFIISEDTYIVNSEKLAKGSKVSGVYDANLPMIMIYPAQYKVEVLVVENEMENVKVDLFDENLLSGDKTLKLNISEDTKIIMKDGSIFEGELGNRNLVVVYGPIMKSLPAQTNPIKVIVLSEEAVEPVKPVSDLDHLILDMDFSGMEFIVENRRIEAPTAYLNGSTTVMVPLRAIAEAMGHRVGWDGKTRTVTIGKDISFKISEDSYSKGEIKRISIGASAEVIAGKTYVPLKFFREVMGLNNAYVFEGQIVIDNGEKME